MRNIGDELDKLMPRCKSKDTHDFPELINDKDSRCWNCRTWEAIDTKVNEARTDELEQSTHYQRTCMFCGYSWLGLHCVHDGYQNPCGNCDRKPLVIDYFDCLCETVIESERLATLKLKENK